MTKINDKEWALTEYEVALANSQTFTIAIRGRVRWALESLIAAGHKGCTPIDNPGPRWAAYVWTLRGEGVEIETLNENHDGPFPGTHARYILRCEVSPVSELGVAA